MTPLNKKATEIFMAMTNDMIEFNKTKKIVNSKAFMPVHIEKLASYDIGTCIAVSHYYKQNGDMMRDPDMEFIVTQSGQVFPAMFRMDNPPVYEESIFFDNGWKVRPALQKQHAAFANQWMQNIKDQQQI
ncbi:DUF6908 domain-containing protein [Desulfobacter postgatei]|uniref:DUF6908 domain-containing protein n=1 Tax=Desulfobacter postgatei TaxID=2293 RepID=UPI002FD92A6A